MRYIANFGRVFGMWYNVTRLENPSKEPVRLAPGWVINGLGLLLYTSLGIRLAQSSEVI